MKDISPTRKFNVKKSGRENGFMIKVHLIPLRSLYKKGADCQLPENLFREKGYSVIFRDGALQPADILNLGGLVTQLDDCCLPQSATILAPASGLEHIL